MKRRRKITDEGKESSEPIESDINREAQAEGRQTPWYKNVSTLISLMALLLSFGTTYFAYTRAEAQNIQNMKTELRMLVDRISSLPREYEESIGKHRGDHDVETAVSATIGHQISLFSSQAAELARRLPRKSVSATEWYSIAVGLQSDLKHEEAKELLGYALEAAKGLIEKVTILRAKADLLFRTGKPREGRDTYEAALGIFSEFASYDDRTKNETQIQTHLSWAESAAFIGLSDEAAEQIAKAKAYWQKLPQDRRTDMIKTIMIGVERHVTPKTSRTNASTLIASKSVGNSPRATPLAKPKPHHSIKKQPSRRKRGSRACR